MTLQLIYGANISYILNRLIVITVHFYITHKQIVITVHFYITHKQIVITVHFYRLLHLNK